MARRRGFCSRDDGIAAIVPRWRGYRWAAGRELGHAYDARLDVQHRLFRPTRTPHSSRVAFGTACSSRSLHFHTDRARGGPRDRPGLPSRNLRNRSPSRSDVLAERPAGGRFRSRIQEVADDQLLGVGPRHVIVKRPVSVFYPVSVHDQAGIRVSLEAARLHRVRRRTKRLRGEPEPPQADRFPSRHSGHALSSFARLVAPMALEWPPPPNYPRSTPGRTRFDSSSVAPRHRITSKSSITSAPPCDWATTPSPAGCYRTKQFSAQPASSATFAIGWITTRSARIARSPHRQPARPAIAAACWNGSGGRPALNWR